METRSRSASPRIQRGRPKRLERTRRLAAALAPLCLVAAMVLPLAVVGGVWSLPETEMARRVGLGEMALPLLTPWQRALLVGIAAFPAGLFARGLLHARRALQGLARAEFFVGETVARLRAFAACASAAAMAGILATALGSVVLTYGLGAGHRRLVAGLGSSELLQLLTAGLVWLMADVLAEAQAIADENAQFV